MQRGVLDNLFSTSFEGSNVSMAWAMFRHDSKSMFCLNTRSRGNVGVVLIVETDELREGYAKYHDISSTDAGNE